MDNGLFYHYRRSGEPPRLGLVQFLLAISGAMLATVRMRHKEIGFFFIIGIVAAIGIGDWSLPFWLSSDVLTAIQHPYRLLSVVSMSAAILTGALVACLPSRRMQSILAIAVIAVYIIANLPRLGLPLPVFARDTTIVSPPAIAQTESEQGVEQGGELSSMVQEFRPRWAAQNLIYQGDETAAQGLEIAVTHANSQETQLTVSTDEKALLRFNDFFFPGWQVLRNDRESLPLSATTDLGLLTVELPPGDHRLTVRYTGGAIGRAAGFISLAAALVLCVAAWRRRERWLAVVPALLLVWGVAAMFYRPPVGVTQPLIESWQSEGLRLAGLRYEQTKRDQIDVCPFWHVLSPQPADRRFHWQLIDATGVVTSETVASPYYNASTAATWPPGTLVDDAVRLTLPPGAEAGEYRLALGLAADPMQTGYSPPQVVTTIALTRTASDEDDGNPGNTSAVFGNQAELTGYSVKRAGRRSVFAADGQPVVRPGDAIRYTLYWRALQPITENYHSFVHLNNVRGEPLAKQDQLPGPFFSPPKIWNAYRAEQDSHLLRIPRDAPGGLYWPSVGLYVFDDLALLSVVQNGEPLPGDNYRLPPIKVIGKPSAPDVRLQAKFQDGFSLKGYSLDAPVDSLRPGDSLSVILSFHNEEYSPRDVTRFVHLYNADFGLAAQVDSQPQDGVNPTSSWAPGETITDRVTLQISEDAVPGHYTLLLGFYDPQQEAVRLGVADERGNPFVDDVVPLTVITIEP